jgi:Fe-S oxidoreductase
VEVLEAAGYRVELATVGDSQRSAMSQGLLAQAKKQGTAMFQRLLPLLRNGAPLLVCEPSCASALSDDLPDLLEDEVLARAVSGRVHMVDEFLEQALSTGQCDLQWRVSERPPTFLVHGHCHQKAMGSGRHALSLLRRIPGAVVQDSEAGCCGMSGAFGYEKEHADISRQIASQRLLPKIEAAGMDVQIVSNGFSCRSQIEDLGGRRPLHVIEAVHGHLEIRRPTN